MLLEIVEDHINPSLRGIPYSFHHEFQIWEESPCTLLLNFHEERHSSHPASVIPIQNELLEQEQHECIHLCYR